MDQASLNHFLAKLPFREVPSTDPSKPPRVVTCVCRLAFSSLAKPKTRVNQETGETREEYSATLIVPPQADVTLLKKIAGNVAAQKFGPKWQALELKMPLKQQAKLNAKGYDGFAETGVYLDVSSKFAVEVVSGKKVNGSFPALDCGSDAVYDGMWVTAVLEPYFFDNKSKGVKFGLRSLQKIADDEEFKGASASSAFEEVDYSGIAANSGNAGVAANVGNAADVWG